MLLPALLSEKRDFTKSVSLDATSGSQIDAEPRLEVVNWNNWTLNSCSIIVLIKRWVEGLWTFCPGFNFFLVS